MPSGRSRRKAPDPARQSATKAEITALDTFRYIETSALLAALLEHDDAARAAIAGKGRRITAALTFAEAARGLVRARMGDRLTSEQERAALRWLAAFRRSCDVIAVTDSILTRAGRPFPVEPIRTLDAIHLASAEEIGEPPQLIVIVTRDTRVRDNAIALGYPVE